MVVMMLVMIVLLVRLQNSSCTVSSDHRETEGKGAHHRGYAANAGEGGIVRGRRRWGLENKAGMRATGDVE